MTRSTQSKVPAAIVLGDGPTGLASALALADAGVAITLIGSAPPPSEDRRTAALMVASVTMLAKLGVWQTCQGAAAPLRRLRLIDDTGRLVRAPPVEFDASEIGEDAFGWNVPHSTLVAALRQSCASATRINHRVGRAERIELNPENAVVHLEGGDVVSAPLLVGADGRGSPARRAAGITADEWDYEQAAIVANLRHERPHDDVSTEFHRSGGPFTLVPLPGNSSSLVWVEPARVAEALAEIDPVGLAREIERLSHRILGRIEIDGPIGLFPLRGLHVRRFAVRRVALVGEAAHVMPPIGAQGLNLGLRDAAMIAEVAGEAARIDPDIGSTAVMNAYDRARRLDVASRAGAVDLLSRTLTSNLMPLQALRALGIAALDQFGPIRRVFMREGAEPHLALPRLMRREIP